MFDVITISETWNDPTTMEPYNIPMYNVFHVCRENAKGGGVAIYVHKNINCKKKKKINKNYFEKKDNIWIMHVYLLLNLRSQRDCGSCRRAVRACGTSLVRWMALQCTKRTACRLVLQCAALKRHARRLALQCDHSGATAPEWSLTPRSTT